MKIKFTNQEKTSIGFLVVGWTFVTFGVMEIKILGIVLELIGVLIAGYVIFKEQYGK